MKTDTKAAIIVITIIAIFSLFFLYEGNTYRNYDPDFCEMYNC